MPDKLFVGQKAKQIDRSPQFEGITGLRMLVDDETEVSAGNSSGYVWEIDSPWATQAQANWLLSQMSGYSYQPYTADTVQLDPAAELGDYVTIGGVYSGIFAEKNTYGTSFTADIAAPKSGDIEHEFPYQTESDRKFSRMAKNIAAEFRIQNDLIAAKVSQVDGNSNSFGWSMTVAGMYWFASGAEVMRCTQEGLRITGEIYATSGNIGGCVIANGVLTVQNANIANLNGSKIDAYSIGSDKYGINSISGGYSGAIASGTISTWNTGGGINTSLGYADFANNVFNGWSTARTVQCSTIIIGGKQCSLQAFLDGTGTTRYGILQVPNEV